MDADEVDAYLESGEAKALIARVEAGYYSEWNGNNTIGTLDEDAQDALEALQQALYNLAGLPENGGAWDAADWFSDNNVRDDLIKEFGITGNTTDARLREIDDALDAVAAHDFVVLNNTFNFLYRLRDEAPEGDAPRDA